MPSPSDAHSDPDDDVAPPDDETAPTRETIDLSNHSDDDTDDGDGRSLDPGLQEALDSAAEEGTVTTADHDEKSPDEIEADPTASTAASPEEAATAAADDAGDDTGSSSTTRSATEGESAASPASDDEEVTSDDLGVTIDDEGVAEIAEAWGEFREETVTVRGIDVTFREPKDDDTLINTFRGLDDPDDPMAQLKAAAQLIVVDPEITDDLWEHKMTPTVRRQIGGLAIQLIGGDFTGE